MVGEEPSRLARNEQAALFSMGRLVRVGENTHTVGYPSPETKMFGRKRPAL
eukprot:CAMPEP_0184688842 /NCGR_PEP_ID=MMETSP0312-20130426/30318_1 /TAXON_ID=31354 /ORGANISM="Compsopogon coeruleus, Strain SAG 36.94" /LENGTH=50 /DNA_ID=CAMNT_0027146111 /DNA_START=403 /DNA_END=555 /DNA_ORIENTATION=-